MPTQPDLSQYTWPAPAKLNLFLRVLGREQDGYHKLQTLFQILDWGDQLRISITDSGNISRICDVDTISLSDDICVKAAELLQGHCGVQLGAHIDLKKNIPLGAGLGGGSSDAATVLVVLNRLWECGLSALQLADIGLKLGADVPVFVHGYSAWAEGRGEKLQAVSLGDRHYVLVFPDFGISTADVFRHPSLKRDSKPLRMTETELQAGRNDCEATARELYPDLENFMTDLRTWGQPFLTGTGSTIFLPFNDKKSAITAASELKCRYNVRAVRGVDKSPLLDSLSICDT
jgi:4-diphosphocytidyl-2-C-methyl-D-erythritol kinase